VIDSKLAPHLGQMVGFISEQGTGNRE